MSRSRLIKWLLLASPILTTLALYGYSIGLPFFWDDGPQFRLLETSNGLDVWLGNADYLYYRPAVFTLWKMSAIFAGFYDGVGLHWLNIIFFGVAGVILGKIAYRLAPHHKLVMALVTAHGFVIFPFSYQAITWIGSMFHTFLALCLALTAWCALIWIDKRRYWALILGNIAGFLGIFSHEIGVVIPVAVVMVWVVGLPISRWMLKHPARQKPVSALKALESDHESEFSAPLVGFQNANSPYALASGAILFIMPLIISTMLFIILYINVPRDTSPGRLQLMSEIVESGATLGQSALYPFIALIRPLIDGTPPAVPMVIGILGGLTVIMLIIIALERQVIYIRLALLGLGWFMMMLAPSLLLLDQFYVNGSPRLLLLPSMGISLFWGVVVIVLLNRRMGQVVAVGIIILGAVVAIRFLNTQRAYFTMQNEYAQRLFSMVKMQPPDANTVLVNAPDYITPLEADRTFLRGAEGAAFLVFTVNYADYLWINTGVDLPNLQTVKYGILNQAVGYSLYAHDPEVGELILAQTVRDADVVYVTQFHADGLTPVLVKYPTTGDDTPLYQLGDALTISELGAVYLPHEKRLRLHIGWQMMNPQVLQAFVHVICAGEMIGQVDAGAWGGAYPFHLGIVDERIPDLREIPLSRPFTSDCQMVLGVYRPSDVSRLSITDLQTGANLPNDQIIIPYLGESEDSTWILKP
ncbi:MAG: hypothetical protein MUE54_03825 [Anaerolineae bacterium]|jgi:hypothetical protein|nr:hypothetical protein [Anaerolineae bacterium]